MYNWRLETEDPCDTRQAQEVRSRLLEKRIPFPGRLIDFFMKVCAGRSVLHLGFVEHSVAHISKPTWKHAAIAAVAGRIVGIDIERAGVEAAAKLGYECHAMDITTSDRLSEKFDVVIAGDIIEHLMSLDALYKFSMSHMKDGASLFISTPNPTCALWFPRVLVGGTFVSNLEHTCWISPSQINEHAYRIGMEFSCYYPILGGASTGPLLRALKKVAFRGMPELTASTNVFELKLNRRQEIAETLAG